MRLLPGNIPLTVDLKELSHLMKETFIYPLFAPVESALY